MGKTKSIEENLSLLIKEVYSEDIIPDKKNLRLFLRKKGIKIHQLIKEAPQEVINKAFPYLMEVLKHLDY